MDVNPNRRRLLGKRHLHAARRLSDFVERADDHIIDRPELGLRLGSARLQSRQVEQVADHPVEPFRLTEDRLDELAPIGLVEVEVAPGERARRSQDCHQR